MSDLSDRLRANVELLEIFDHECSMAKLGKEAADAIEAMEIEILWLRETIQITYVENTDMRSLLETDQWQYPHISWPDEYYPTHWIRNSGGAL